MKNNVRSGTPPATPKNTTHLGLNNNPPNGSVKSMSSNSTGSLEVSADRKSLPKAIYYMFAKGKGGRYMEYRVLW